MPSKKATTKSKAEEKSAKATVVGDAYLLRENMNKETMTTALMQMNDEELRAIAVAEGFGSQSLKKDEFVAEIVSKWLSSSTPSRATPRPAPAKPASKARPAREPKAKSGVSAVAVARGEGPAAVVGNAYLLRENMSRDDMADLLDKMSREELEAVAVAEGFVQDDATKEDLVEAILNRWAAIPSVTVNRGGVVGDVRPGYARVYPEPPANPNTPRSARVGRIFGETGK